MALPLACAAILGRENEPLYIRSFGEQSAHELLADPDNLKWHFYVHSSLDLIEQRVQKKDVTAGGAANSASNMDPYLGLLCPIDEYRVYVQCGHEQIVGIGNHQCLIMRFVGAVFNFLTIDVHWRTRTDSATSPTPRSSMWQLYAT